MSIGEKALLLTLTFYNEQSHNIAHFIENSVLLTKLLKGLVKPLCIRTFAFIRILICVYVCIAPLNVETLYRAYGSSTRAADLGASFRKQDK